MEPTPADITSLLNKLAAGDQEAAAQLVPLVYEELRHLAARRLRQERPDHPFANLARDFLYGLGDGACLYIYFRLVVNLTK